jgi:hypothetical protein
MRDCSSVAVFISRSSFSFEDGGKCGGGRQEIQFLIPCIIARVSCGAVAVRRSQILISWRSVLGLMAPGWLLQRRWCSVDSISMYPIGQLWLSRSSKIIDRLWLYCQLWVILFTLTYLTIGRKERYLSKLGQSTISKIEMSQPCFCMMQF